MTTGFSYEHTVRADAEEAQKRVNEKERIARIYRREGEYAGLTPEQALEEGKKASQEGFKSASDGNARVGQLAETTAHRAEIGKKVAGAVQDVNAAVAYTGGTILGGPGGGVAATSYVR